MEERIIHQIWYQGGDALPEKYQKTSQKLRDMNPGWRYMLWDDRSMRALCRKFGYEDAYDASKIMHQRIDFGRYLALYCYGGVSIDMDTDSLRPIDTFVDEYESHGDRPNLGITRITSTPIEASIAYMRPTTIALNNATVVAPRKRMPCMKHICDHIADLLRNQSSLLKKMPKSMQIQRTTGPSAFTDAVLSLPPDEVQYIDAEVFEPCIGFDAACKPSDRSITNHQHDGTWHGMGGLLSLYFWIKHHKLPILVVVLVLLLVVMLWRMRR
jgi:mannosyltransferase OCH1-like enzyme